ncbi:MAG: DUF1538 domain-containing protein [Bacilli bacterium]|nr:DUF1538 domain-containing protein [Bacilli bacterium]
MKEWGRTFLNAALSTFPVVIIVAILNWSGLASFNDIATLNGNGTWLFISGAILLYFGIAFFSIGTDNAMSKIGEHVGGTMTAHKNLFALVFIVFLLGLFVTIAEPDLSVLAGRLEPAINFFLFIALVGIGVGIFLVIGVLRILLQKSLKVWILAFYALIFALACLVDESFIPLTFDSGGVTTGPVTVPFIIALGVGIATSRAGKSSNADSFGLTAFCSIGPLIVVLIFGLFTPPLEGTVPDYNIVSVGDALLHSLGTSAMNVTIAMAPVLVFFFIYNAIVIHLPKKEIIRIIVGLVYTYIGLVLFLTGVEGAFTPIADALGQVLMDKDHAQWMLLLVAGLIGLVVVLCEPAVQVLVKQVEQVSDGRIKKRHMLIALSLGIATGVVLAVVRILYGFSLFYYVVPGYIIALALTFAVPDIYVGVAFDSGGVASGPMTSAFILPFALSIGKAYCVAHPDIDAGRYIMTNAFGTVAMVAMMPLIVIQLLGLNATLEEKHIQRVARQRVRVANDNQVIHFGA